MYLLSWEAPYKYLCGDEMGLYREKRGMSIGICSVRGSGRGVYGKVLGMIYATFQQFLYTKKIANRTEKLYNKVTETATEDYSI